MVFNYGLVPYELGRGRASVVGLDRGREENVEDGGFYFWNSYDSPFAPESSSRATSVQSV